MSFLSDIDNDTNNYINNHNSKNDNLNNGRIDIMGPNTTTLFSLQDKIPTNQPSSYRDAMNGNWYDTPLSTAFFSAENITILQNGIRAGVYKLSKGEYVIGTQDNDDLKVIMRGVFLQHSKNLPTDIPKQISELNHVVLDYAVPQVYNEAIGYLKYKKDVSSMYTPMPPPIQADYKNKSLEYPKWL